MYVLYVTRSDSFKPQQSDNNCPGDVGDDLTEVGDLVPSSGSNNDGSVGVVGVGVLLSASAVVFLRPRLLRLVAFLHPRLLCLVVFLRPRLLRLVVFLCPRLLHLVVFIHIYYIS